MKTQADFLLYSDESCPLEFDGNDLMAIGFIYCPHSSKTEIFNELRKLKINHGIDSRIEVKWTKVSLKRLDYYKAVIDYFYNRNDIGIRILLANNKSKLNHHKYNKGSYREWYYKMYYFLLDRVIDENYKYFMMFDQKEKETLYRLKEVKRRLKNHKNNYSIQKKFDFEIKQINSKESELIQILDLFLGAVTYRNRKLYNKIFDTKKELNAKDKIIDYIEGKYNNILNKKTSPYETKFNLFLWYPISEVNNE